MTVISIPSASPPLRLAWLLLIGLLVVALGSGAALIGSQILSSTRIDDARLSTAVIPQGGEAVIAFGTVNDTPDQKAGDIYTVRADGTDLRQLTDGPEYEADPAWSPDGSRIAFRSWQGGTDSIVVMDHDGGNRVTLASSSQPTQDCLMGSTLAWAPDGSSLIYPIRNGCEGTFDLWIVATDGTGESTPLLTESFDARFAAWRPDGRALAFIGQDDAPGVGLYVMDTDPAQALDGPARGRRIGPDLGSDLVEVGVAPRWSPDGTTLLVSSLWRLGGGETPGVHLVPADGVGQTLTIEDALNPAWSPDGSQIAFQRPVTTAERFSDRPCTVRTWLADPDGSNERSLDELGDGCDFGPSWSPDGSRILGLWIDTDPASPDTYPFYLSVITVDGSSPPVHLLDSSNASWQPVVPSAP